MAEPTVVVDVWTSSPAVVSATDQAVLDRAERARAAALPAAAADRFVLGRVLLRHALATRMGCHPGDVVLSARCSRCGGPHGPVQVTPPPGRSSDLHREAVHVSVTRGGPIVAIAVCEGAPVGIDVEARTAVASAPLAEVALSPSELVAHRGRSRRAGVRSLARTWVRKEAALKALGVGLDLDPRSVELQSPVCRARGVDAVVGGSVAVTDLAMGRGVTGAVAVVAAELVPAVTCQADAPRPALVIRRYDGFSTFGGRRM